MEKENKGVKCMKVLLTGSEGYIGTNFRKLYSNRFHIVNIDKKLTTRAEEFNDFEGIDYIIHLAAISGIKACEDNFEQAINDNISSTFHLMKAAWAYNIPMIFTSSQGAKDPKSSFYSLTKSIGEHEAQRYNKNGADIKVLRLANVFGGMKYYRYKTSVMAKFAKMYNEGQPLTVHGDGTQTRDFIHCHEVCKCFMACMGTVAKFDKPMDLGTGIERTIKEVAKKFTSNIEFSDERTGGVESNVANTKPLHDEIGFQAEDRLDEWINQIKW